jgi:excisionase family DNA binding protein
MKRVIIESPYPGGHAGALAYSIKETARLLAIGRTKVYELIKDGTLVTIHVGKRQLVPAWRILALLRHPEAHATEPDPHNQDHDRPETARRRHRKLDVDLVKSLLRLFYAWARKEGLNPKAKRQTVAPRLRGETERCGCRVDDDTIRAIIRDAVALVEDDKHYAPTVDRTRSLLRLIYTWMQKEGHDLQTAAARMHDETARRGCSVDVDTIKAVLRDAIHFVEGIDE